MQSLTPAYKQPIVYNFNVFRSLCRQVYQAEKLAPPTHLSQWASAYSQIFSAAASPAFWQKAMSNGQAAKIAVAVSPSTLGLMALSGGAALVRA